MDNVEFANYWDFLLNNFPGAIVSAKYKNEFKDSNINAGNKKPKGALEKEYYIQYMATGNYATIKLHFKNSTLVQSVLANKREFISKIVPVDKSYLEEFLEDGKKIQYKIDNVDIYNKKDWNTIAIFHTNMCQQLKNALSDY